MTAQVPASPSMIVVLIVLSAIMPIAFALLALSSH